MSTFFFSLDVDKDGMTKIQMIYNIRDINQSFKTFGGKIYTPNFKGINHILVLNF